MQLITTKQQLLETRNLAQSKNQTIALVPTMGALHEGHLSLVEIAKQYADLVFVSIFVNPLQFGPSEDFSKYPRTLENDLKLLELVHCDYVFAPSAEELYLEDPKQIKANPDIANKLCGLTRPGHFDGVCTVVNLLFELIRPQFAVFGQKDYQQLKVIESMLEELGSNIRIIPAPIVREDSGLAMSSRNRYLTEFEKSLAAEIYKNLSWFANNYSELNLERTKDSLQKLGIQVEYLENHWDRILIAAKVGSTRLIDNVALG